MFRPALAVLVAAAIALVAARFGLTQALGAHPVWAVQVAWIGVPIGAVVAFLALWRGLAQIWAAPLFAAVTAAALAAAFWGKAEFAASFAENARAGQAWYYGWIIAAAGATATLAALVPFTRG
ncbi:MAG: hypothetical protein AAF771_04280 [Pseudomonadota bacterium]